MAEPVPVVSVALGTFRGERFLRPQLESILDQSRPVDEVVIGDDGSDDATLRIVEEVWAERGVSAPSLRVLEPGSRLGVTKNFERIIAACRGDVILLSDQDDVWAPDRVQRSLDALHADDADFVFGNARLVDADGAPLGTRLFESLEIAPSDLAAIRAGHAFSTLLRRNLATGATVALRAEAARRAMPFPAPWVHDEWLAIHTAAIGRVSWIDADMIDYRQHSANQIGAQRPTLRHKLRVMLTPGSSRNAGLRERFEVLADRLSAEPTATPRDRAEAESKRDHERFRASLPSSRWRRIGPVARQARTGAYGRYSARGRLDIVRDLIQPSS